MYILFLSEISKEITENAEQILNPKKKEEDKIEKNISLKFSLNKMYP